MTKLAKDAERWKKIVRQFSEVSITVLADLVADEFVFGEIARVSREAPVLILKHRERTVVPGGGANAVMNLASLGVNVLPVGVVGDDEAGSLAAGEISREEDSVGGIQRLQGYTTTTKTRILAGMSHTSRQQVVRVDREPEPLGEMHPALLNLVNAAQGICDSVGCDAGLRLRIWRRDPAAADVCEVEWLPGEQAHHRRLALSHSGLRRRDGRDAERAGGGRGAAHPDRS